MKKIICIILSIILIFGITVPSFAVDDSIKNGVSIPIIKIGGHGTPLAYNNGESTFNMSSVMDLIGETYGDFSTAAEAYWAITKPFILKGILQDDWQDYYDVMYEKVSEAFKPVQLDCDGNATAGTGVTYENQMKMAIDKTPNYAKLDNGKFNILKYFEFYYDWRIDPCEAADQLNDYIQDIKKSTGSDKVGLNARCMGTNVVLAYIDKYGTDDLKGVGLDVAVTNGSELVDSLLTGQFGIDGHAISRYVSNSGRIKGNYSSALDFGSCFIELLEAEGVFDGITSSAKKAFYDKIQYGIISALGLSTVMTFPGYWGMVSYDKFDEAVNYVFGSEGSQKRTEYAKLLEKITNYNENVKKNSSKILSTLEESGVNICIVAKYGVQMIPIIKDNDIIGDEYSSITKATFGATTSTIGTTLSDEYITAQTQKGLGKYISPDKQIDTSTCLFPDYTWVLKGVSHGKYLTDEILLIYSVIDASKQLTVDDFEYSQFIMCDAENDSMRKMTENDCADYWLTDETKYNAQADKNTAVIKSILEIFKSFFIMLFKGAFSTII